MNEPLVSIVIPTFNRATMLPRSVESCLRQTYRNLEVIVVDDGSRDETPEVAQSLADRDARVRYVRQENMRLPGALNTGHRLAQGSFLTWTSDDNQFDPNAIETMAGHLQRHPEVGLVYCNVRLVDVHGNVLEERKLPGPEKLWKGSCVGACFLYRREVHEAVGEYDRGLFLAEDYDFWLRVSKHFAIAHLADVTAYSATCHSGSLTETHRPLVEIQCAKAQAKNAGDWRAARRFLASGYFEAAYDYRVRRQYGRAASSLLHSMVYWPLQARSYKCALGLGLDVVKHALRLNPR